MFNRCAAKGPVLVMGWEKGRAAEEIDAQLSPGGSVRKKKKRYLTQLRDLSPQASACCLSLHSCLGIFSIGAGGQQASNSRLNSARRRYTIRTIMTVAVSALISVIVRSRASNSFLLRVLTDAAGRRTDGSS